MITDLDKVSEIINQTSKGDYSNIGELNKSLTSMEGDVLNAELGGVVAFAIPNQFISANVFGKAYTESFVSPIIDSRICSDKSCELNSAKASSINAVSVGVTELGITLAKYQTFLGQHIAFGVTPKLQRVYTYVYEASLNSYDIKDFETMGQVKPFSIWMQGSVVLWTCTYRLFCNQLNLA